MWTIVEQTYHHRPLTHADRNRSRRLAVTMVVKEATISVKRSVMSIWRNDMGSTPDIGRLESPNGHTSYNPKIAEAAFEGPKQVGVGICVDVHDLTGSEDSLEVDHVVDRVANTVPIRADTTSQQQTADTWCCLIALIWSVETRRFCR